VLIKNYIDATLLVKPIASTEVPVKGKEYIICDDNFTVQWRSNDSLPLVQVLSLNAKNRVVTTEHRIPIH
jgi:hypothetical protein